MKLLEGNIFSRVCQSFCPLLGIPSDLYTSCIGPHKTGAHPTTWTLPDVVLASSLYSAYCLQAGSWHSTSILSCFCTSLMINENAQAQGSRNRTLTTVPCERNVQKGVKCAITTEFTTHPSFLLQLNF